MSVVLQARGEDQDPGEESERPDRRELHGAERGSPTAGVTLCLSTRIVQHLFLSGIRVKIL